ncbi:trypsin-5-like [Bacillus rossius redtenbacheri]|uniref:trypsin-5-like n=1 Tax=Bacillus rossius redtenbacheri TaxID=93214 RepID=UPI002FDD0E8D
MACSALLLLSALGALCTGFPHQGAGQDGQLGLRIAGSSATTIANYPYVVSVREDLQGGYDVHVGGGSIVSNHWVLTAATTVHADVVEMYKVRVGSDHVDKGTRYTVAQIVFAKGANPADIASFDAALIKVASPFVFSAKVKAVKLAAAGSSWNTGTTATVAGWGPILPEGNTQDQIRVATVSVVAHSECTTAYKECYHKEYMLCVSHKNERKGPCVNDEGSALVHNGEQIGIASFTTSCFNGTTNAGPGIFSSVSYFRNWIKAETGV